MTRILYIAVAIGLILLLASLDYLLATEPFEAADFALDLLETTLLVGAMVVIAFTTGALRDLRSEHASLRSDMERAEAEVARALVLGEAWRERSRTHLEGLSEAIARQFAAWDLTPAEAEIGGLMLKGMSLKEIAIARQTGQATIRQQAAGIYRKSKLGGRAEFAAYFLDSLAPVPPLRVEGSSGA